jgi:hypothetical protein
MCRRVPIVRTDVSGELIPSIIRVTKISNLLKSWQQPTTEAHSNIGKSEFHIQKTHFHWE